MTSITLPRAELPVEINGKHYTIRSTPETRAMVAHLQRKVAEAEETGAYDDQGRPLAVVYSMDMIDALLGAGASKELFSYCEFPAPADVIYILQALTAEMRAAKQ